MLIVAGSIYIDKVFSAGSIPEKGKTAEASGIVTLPAGKGLAQALAASRMETRTALVGRTGGEPFIHALLPRIRRHGVMTSGIVESETPTGVRLSIVTPEGKNAGVHYAGANSEVSGQQVPEEILGPGNFVLLQNELSREVNLEIISKAKSCGATTILSLYPYSEESPDMLEHADYAVLHAGLGEDQAVRISREHDLCCVVHGEDGGAFAADREGRIVRVSVPDRKREGARNAKFGEDCFAGTFAACLHDGFALEDALKYAVAASFLSDGDDPLESFPYKYETESLLEEERDG